MSLGEIGGDEHEQFDDFRRKHISVVIRNRRFIDGEIDVECK